uniref:hypothetical protein n=1 Tax=Herbiconiux sp. TaxID=1871186 RepID=UPI0025C51AEA
VYVPRDLARAVASATTLPTAPVTIVPAAASAAALPAAASTPAVPVGAAPLVDGPDPRDDDALRALVAHHAEVAEATARNHNQVRWVI